MSFLSNLKAAEERLATLVQYIPLVNSTVQQIEAAMPGASGTSKFQAALTAILAVAHAGETVPNATVQIISMLIDTAVGLFNSLGLFKKASPPTGVTVPPIPVTAP